MSILISSIIPTIGRESLSRAVQSVLDQELQGDEFEVIVVNDSGQPLSFMSWMESPRVHVLNTHRRERSVARNAGAAVARGTYLHFLDDDDWMLPGAFSSLRAIIKTSDAGMIYGGYRFVDANEKRLQECHPDERGNCFIRFMTGEWQPLQASLFNTRIFHLLGGFTSLDLLRGGDEDVDFTRRLSLQHEIAGCKEPVAVIRIDRSQSTTNYSNLQEQSRHSREMILNLPGVYSRLRDSAEKRQNASAYWHGRMAWIYLSSVAWNLKQRNIFRALSRLAFFGLTIAHSIRFWLSPRFWRGATRGHQANGWLVAD